MGNRQCENNYDISDKLYIEATTANKPVIVSQTGRKNLVVMSEEIFKKHEENFLFAQAREKILAGEQALAENRTVEFESWIKKFAVGKGFSLNVQN